MPFAYAGTRRRRNRDRRRAHDTLESSAAQPDGTRPTEAREERDPTATRRAADEERATAREPQRGEMPPGVGSEDLLDPGSRDPDAPPVDNRS
ncbi:MULTISPECIES: hypothetical protein [unclassified Cupriavidus]|uniref:hypothetical protein n=1 Tax=unclassified Cupriavidus TaxID=2640874 RepID=UPI0028B9C0E9|nr:hypothetical protein [Cupriavidus sp. SZY C1]MDT6961816.1 hypothetical protein [Cupriavidus sp. SZY C1]